MSEDRELRAILEDTQARLKTALLRSDELERRARLSEAKEQQLEERVARLQARLGTVEPVASAATSIRDELSRLEARLAALDQAVPPLPPGSVCQRCGDDGVLDASWVGTPHSRSPLMAAVESNPRALVFKGSLETGFTARVCSRCGYTELFADAPEELAKADARAQGAP